MMGVAICCLAQQVAWVEQGVGVAWVVQEATWVVNRCHYQHHPVRVAMRKPAAAMDIPGLVEEVAEGEAAVMAAAAVVVVVVVVVGFLARVRHTNDHATYWNKQATIPLVPCPRHLHPHRLIPD